MGYPNKIVSSWIENYPKQGRDNIVNNYNTYLFQVSFLLLLSGYSQPDYGDGYKYQPYAIAIGIILGILPILGLIGGGVWQIASVKGNIVQVRNIFLYFVRLNTLTNYDKNSSYEILFFSIKYCIAFTI